MMGLLGIFILFTAAGFIILRNLGMHAREKWTFAIITMISFLLWASIVIEHPLDLNKGIGWVIDKAINSM